MTRINVGIPPRSLTQKHLLSEHREIKRIPNVVSSGKANLDKLPNKFTLGAGHVRFFYNKLGYLRDRYAELHAECISRGYNVQDYIGAWNGIPSHLMGDYEPSVEDIKLVEDRINERLRTIGNKDDRGTVQLGRRST